MKFIYTKEGYISVDYVRRLVAVGERIIIEDTTSAIHFIDKEFADDEAAQNYLDELIEELEKE